MSKYILFGLLFLAVTGIRAQEKTIRVKKLNFYFFQKGKATDTISKSHGRQFYLIVPDSLKPLLSIHVKNGFFTPTANDSIIEFHYLPGYKYECRFTQTEEKEKTKGGKMYRFMHYVNGVTGMEEKKVEIEIFEPGQLNPILTNIFYYRE